MNYLLWAVALLSTGISLIFSEVLKLPPCSLCWYQRIFMYALVFVLPTGILLQDRKLSYYTSVLSAAGLLISIYHNLLYYGWISEGFSVCTAELSCKTKQFELFGVLSIPLMSFMSFVVLLAFSLKGVRDEKRS